LFNYSKLYFFFNFKNKKDEEIKVEEPYMDGIDLGMKDFEYVKEIDTSTCEKCISIIMSEDIRRIINDIPYNDFNNTTNNNNLKIILDFFMILTRGVLSNDLIKSEDNNRYLTIQKQLSKMGLFDKLLYVFKKVTNDNYKRNICYIIGRFHCGI
jgi:hypothetical protein